MNNVSSVGHAFVDWDAVVAVFPDPGSWDSAAQDYCGSFLTFSGGGTLRVSQSFERVREQFLKMKESK